MRVVAVRTTDLARIDRMGRNAVSLGALFLVTSEADFGLSLFVTYLVGWRMDGVTVVAG